ncbi:MAG: zf-HC2 domain-containing protein [Pyrinomonadaceae bacterium]|nr:zf-HC2 domain-containing protein [Pyrinomonadaceae bacterium]
MKMPRKLLEWRAKRPCASAHHRQLSAYLDGEIDGDARACVEQHLAACSPCRAEYEQLRFASRALSHFIVPNVRQPVWQIEPAFLQRQSAPPLALWLKRFCAMKIAVPAPVFVAGSLAAITVAALLLTHPFVQTQTPAASPVASVPTIETKIIEVPVEREVVRERIRCSEE